MEDLDPIPHRGARLALFAASDEFIGRLWHREQIRGALVG